MQIDMKLLRAPFTQRRVWIILFVDILAIMFSQILSFGLRFNWSIPILYVTPFTDFVLLCPLVYVPSFLAFKMYKRVWRYASPKDFYALWLAVTTASVLIKAMDVVMPNINLPNSIWLSAYLLTLVITGGVRALIKSYGSAEHERTSTDAPKRKQRVLIYGAGSAGAVISREADRNHAIGWDIVGFMDDDKQKRGLTLNQHPILGSRSAVGWIIQEKQVDRILIAIPSMKRNQLRKIVDELNVYRIPILIIPPITRWTVNNLFSYVRPVDVEDLLGREPLPIDVLKIGAYLKDSIVLVTGAGGSIGAEICRQVAAMNPRHLILLGRGENSIFEIHRELKDKYPQMSMDFCIGDIRDRKKMERVFAAVRPEVVFHAAAHKHVPLMEEHPDEAFQNNVQGTRILVELAQFYEVERFILISSDKAVRPTNVMGASKRIAEMALLDMAGRQTQTRFVAVRFGNVLGSRGSVVRVFRDQIAKGGPVTVTDPRMKRYFMTIPEAVRLVLEAGAIGVNGHIYLLDMGEPVQIMDLAERMIRLSGFVPGADIPIEITGIRPGEKLFEELSRESDSVSIDPNKRIWSVTCPIMPQREFAAALEYLAELYDSNKQEELAFAVKELAWWDGKDAVAVTANGSFAESRVGWHLAVQGSRP